MNELSLQALVVSAVRGRGGYAFKLNNRFLGGVLDLLVQIPGKSMAIWEVKRGEYKKEAIPLALTEMQEKNLRDLTNATGFGGVISFLETDKHQYMMQAIPFPTMLKNDKGKWVAMAYDHVQLIRGKREEIIIETLMKVTP